MASLLPLALLFLAQAAPTVTPPSTTIHITAVVTARDGRAASRLTPADLELREDGAVQRIESVVPRPDGPLRIALLLDEFHVGADATDRVRRAAHAFVEEHLHEGDQAVVVRPLDSLPSIQLTANRDRLHDAIDRFEGRKGNYTPRSPLEADTVGVAPALAEATRAQIVLSALRTLAARLDGTHGRSAIVLVSDGFSPDPRAVRAGILPDAGVVERYANRSDVPIYAIAPDAAAADDPDRAALGGLAARTGGTLSETGDLAASLNAVVDDLGRGIVITYHAPHGPDGKFHAVRLTSHRKDTTVRARAGYISALPFAPAALERARANPLFASRLLRRSPLVNVWSGITRLSGASAEVAVTWTPARAAGAARVSLVATDRDGKVLFEGMLAPLRSLVPGTMDVAVFPVTSGPVQLDMTILDVSGRKLDTDARDVDVPDTRRATILLPPIIVAADSEREFRTIVDAAQVSPDPSQSFRRTERLLIRVPASSAGGGPTKVTARLLNRQGRPMLDLPALPAASGGVAQFDLLLAPFAPGDYILEFTATGAGSTAQQRVPLRVTG